MKGSWSLSAKIVFRIRAMFRGFWNALTKVFSPRWRRWLIPVRMAVADLMNSLKGLFASFGSGEVTKRRFRLAKVWRDAWRNCRRRSGRRGAGLVYLVEGIKFLAGIASHVIGYVSSLCSGLFI